MCEAFTLSDAIKYADLGRIEDWVHSFLCGIGDNRPFSEGLKLYKRYYTRPVLVDLENLTRICGPEEGIKYPVDRGGFEYRVSGIMEAFQKGWDMPPLIVGYHGGQFELNDGNHRYEALIRSGVKQYYVIFWSTDTEDYHEIIAKYRLST